MWPAPFSVEDLFDRASGLSLDHRKDGGQVLEPSARDPFSFPPARRLVSGLEELGLLIEAIVDVSGFATRPTSTVSTICQW